MEARRPGPVHTLPHPAVVLYARARKRRKNATTIAALLIAMSELGLIGPVVPGSVVTIREPGMASFMPLVKSV